VESGGRGRAGWRDKDLFVTAALDQRRTRRLFLVQRYMSFSRFNAIDLDQTMRTLHVLSAIRFSDDTRASQVNSLLLDILET
jgi:hypothetical protein